MKLTFGNLARLKIVAPLTIALSALTYLPAYGQFEELGINADDGTYKTIIVTSSAECIALCKAEDETCRGTLTVQPDTSKPEMQCRLNDGTGANPAFPPIPPEPLNLDIALADLNAYRAQSGLSAVSLSAPLNAVSQSHAEDRAAAGKISHEGSDGLGHGDRLLKANYIYSIAAENVASGQKSWEQVFKAWQDSPGHDVNLLRDDVTEFVIDVQSHAETDIE